MTNNEKNMKVFRFEVVKDVAVRPGNTIKIESVRVGRK